MTLIYAKYQLGIVGGYEPTIALSALVCIWVINSLVIRKEHIYIPSLVAIWALWGIMHNIYTIDTHNTLWMTCVAIASVLAIQNIVHYCLSYIYPHHAR
jgi:branched-subunit amino acid transport protein